MKRVSAIFAVVLICLIGACSKSGDEAEAKSIINEMTMTTEKAAGKLDAAVSAQEAADIIKTFKIDMDKLAKKGAEFDKQHPGINVKDGHEFKSERDAMMNAMKHYGISSMKARIRFDGAKELADQAENNIIP